MLTPISTNASPSRPESSTHKLCCSSTPEGSKAIRDIENACRAKSLKAKKESKGPILKRKMACATCRRRKLRCDAARPRCSTCARSQASAEAAGHPSAVPPGPCTYDCDSCDEPAPSRFFTNGSFHSLTFHNHRNGAGPNPLVDPASGMDNLNILPPSSPYGVWAWGEVPLTPSRAAPNTVYGTPVSMTTTPTRPVVMSTPMRRIVSPSLTINSTPVQENDLFYSPASQASWTPSPQPMHVEPMYVSPMVSPMVHSFSEGAGPLFLSSSLGSGPSSAASTPSLAATRAVRSPFGLVQDLGTPASLAPSTPCSETFDTTFLGPPIGAKHMLMSAHEQQIKCANFLQSLEPMPYDLLDYSATPFNDPGCAAEQFGFAGTNDLGLIPGPTDAGLQEPFVDFAHESSTLSSAMPIDFAAAQQPSGMVTASLEWVA